MTQPSMGSDRERSLLQLLEVVPSAAFIFDVQNEVFIASNERFNSLFGYSAEELRALRWQDFVLESERDLVQKVLDSEIAPTEPSQWHVKHADTSLVQITVTFRFMDVVRNEGNLVRAVFVLIVNHPDEHPISASR